MASSASTGTAQVSAHTGTGPIDLDFSRDGRFLYTLGGADHTITIDRLGPNGSLAAVGTVTGLPATTVGLVAD